MVLKHVAWLLLGAAVGWQQGDTVAGLAVAAIAALAWHLYKLAQLRDALTSDGHDRLPGSVDDWSRILHGVQRLRDSVAKSKRVNRRLKKQWRKITNALPDAGLLLDKSFNIIQFNETARAMLRIDDDADTGRPITNLIRNPAFVDAVENRRFDKAVRFSTAREPDRTLSGLLAPLDRGQHILIVRDVSERVRADKVKTDFVANASHELRTPLTVLKGYLLELADDAELGAGWREPVAEMNLHVDRMQSLVTDLLCLNQFEAEVDAPMARVDIAGILERGCKEARQLSKRSAEVLCECVSDRELYGDESALRSVVTNLLTNAVRFTPIAGRITARWQADEAGGQLIVSDSGIGIDPDEIDRVTERFYRSDAGRTRHHGGTGLGLAIVKHALAMHQAHLEIVSEPDTGSTFTCHFPPERICAPEC